jgi:hypothetical protein
MYKRILFFLLCLATHCFCQYATIDSIKADSIPNATFFFQQTTQTFLLNNFLPQKDSCENLEISFEKPFGIRALFQLNDKRVWSLDTVMYNDYTLQNTSIKTAISKDASGNLQKVCFFISSKDSSLADLKIQLIGDIPVIRPDSLAPQQSSCTIRRSVFLCVNEPVTIHEVRVFVYPANYMKREPTLNYPELSMFHYGGSVKMPTDESVRLRGFIINYWHLQNPPPLQYGGPMKEIREKVEKPREERKRFFTWKPIGE